MKKAISLLLLSLCLSVLHARDIKLFSNKFEERIVTKHSTGYCRR